MANTLLDISTIKDVRISVSRDFWRRMSFYESLEPRVFGTLQQWRLKKEFRIDILWDDDTREPLGIGELLPYDLSLEPYADNRPAPRPKRRRNVPESANSLAPSAVSALGNQPASSAPDPAGPASGNDVVNLIYTRGSRPINITWEHISCEGISVDART